MPSRPCPQCQRETPRKLDAASEFAHVSYYRCDDCGHVWTVSKDAKETIRHVTPLRPPTSNAKQRIAPSVRGNAPVLSLADLTTLASHVVVSSRAVRRVHRVLLQERCAFANHRRELVAELRQLRER